MSSMSVVLFKLCKYCWSTLICKLVVRSSCPDLTAMPVVVLKEKNYIILVSILRLSWMERKGITHS